MVTLAIYAPASTNLLYFWNGGELIPAPKTSNYNKFSYHLHDSQGQILLVGGPPGANNEDGSSLIIHWSSGSHKRSTNWANQYDIYLVGPGAMAPWTP